MQDQLCGAHAGGGRCQVRAAPLDAVLYFALLDREPSKARGSLIPDSRDHLLHFLTSFDWIDFQQRHV
jgi:hypothetical protein